MNGKKKAKKKVTVSKKTKSQKSAPASKTTRSKPQGKKAGKKVAAKPLSKKKVSKRIASKAVAMPSASKKKKISKTSPIRPGKVGGVKTGKVGAPRATPRRSLSAIQEILREAAELFSNAKVIRKYNLSPATFYAWKRKHGKSKKAKASKSK